MFKFVRSKKPRNAPGEQNAEWYDREFDGTPEYHQHYTQTNYYFLWSVVADRILRSGVRRLLEIGCGPGQFAALLRDKGFDGYQGADFSARRIAFAKQQCPAYDFVVADLKRSNLLEDTEYDCLLAMEFLEHVEDDLEILRRAKARTKVFATVPNFPYISHVRYFRSSAEVESRYQPLFSELRIDSFLENEQGKTFFLIEATRA